MLTTARLLLLLTLVPAAHGFVATAELPDLLTTLDGQSVTTEAEWRSRRVELKALLQEHILGTLPPLDSTPRLTSASAVNHTIAHGVASCYVRLAYDANDTAVVLDVELAWPAERQRSGGKAAGPGLPLFLTQWNHRAWAMQGVQRGYMMVLYPGADTRDASGAFRAAFPGASFRKILARAFVASRVLDYVLATTTGTNVTAGLPPHFIPAVDPSRVCITGHSRNGKQSLIAAAFDERFSAVVGSSPGTPIAAPVRFSSPDFNGETAHFVTPHRDWWLPSLRSYYGREHELPADGHMVLALIAPRFAMLATARSDSEGDTTFADEMNVIANMRVWSLLNAPRALHIKFREGRHHGFDDPQNYVDWFDYSGRIAGTDLLFPLPTERGGALPHAFNWTAWNARELARGVRPPLPSPTAPLTARIGWLLGSSTADPASSTAETSTGGLVIGEAYAESSGVGGEWDFKAKLMMHDSFRACRKSGATATARILNKSDRALPPTPVAYAQCKYNVTRLSFSFGAYITASLFVPCNDPRCTSVGDPTAPLPVVMLLPGFSYSMGYTGIYGLFDSAADGGLINAVVGQLGVAVLAWDLPGMGARQTEAHETFYRRYARGASRLGAMVGEVQSALDFIRCAGTRGGGDAQCSDGSSHAGPYSALAVPTLDPQRVYLLGYSMGAIVGLHAAALINSSRIAGVAAFGGWTPFKENFGSVATGGNRFLYEKHALIPRLGLFRNESRLLYDYEELISSLAPRPVLLHAPLRNRFAQPAAVAAAATGAAMAWEKAGASADFTFVQPNATSDFKDAEIAAALQWLERVLS